MNLLERSHLDMAIARLAAKILAEAFAEARRYPPSAKTSPSAARKIDEQREDALRWLTDVEGDHIFSLASICRILSVASGQEFSATRIAALIAAGKRPDVEGRVTVYPKKVSAPRQYRRRAA